MKTTVLGRAVPAHPPSGGSRRLVIQPRTQVRLLALAVTGAGFLNVISALTPELEDRLGLVRTVFTPGVTDLADGATALLGLTLILLGRGIARHRRLAYRVALGVLALSALTHVVKGFDIEEAVAALVVAALLLRSGRLFGEPTQPARWRMVGKVLVTAVPACFVYGIVGFAARHDNVHPHLTVVGVVEETSARLIGLTGPLHVSGAFGHWFPASITVLGFASMIAIAASALAPVAERTVGPSHDRERVARLVHRADGDSLDPFALRRDKRYVFSSDGRAAIAYRYVNGVGLAAGDPVGEPGSFPDCLAKFLARCDQKGWVAAVLGASEPRIGLYRDAGLRAQYIGDEAVIDVEAFTLEGRPMRPARQAVNRTKNFGITTEIIREGDLDPTLRRALIGIADRHRGAAPERGFSMALDQLLSGEDRDCVIALARDCHGTPIAFQHYVPCKAGAGLSLDVMRRDRVGPNGVNERMIADVVTWAREHSIDEVSLNFAAFKGFIEAEAELGPIQTAQAWVIKRLNPYFQIESLLVFNSRFRPRWVPRFLVYRTAPDLPRVIVASLSAESFLPFDRSRRQCEELAAADAEERDPGTGLQVAAPVGHTVNG